MRFTLISTLFVMVSIALLGPSQAYEICKKGDTRTQIDVWEPKINDKGDLAEDPPTEDGKIFYIAFGVESDKFDCGKPDAEKKLFSLSRPNNPNSAMDGGLAVNFRGNVQFAGPWCYFRGFYMNESVMGIHQGWTETYFGAVSKEQIVTSGKFCLSKKPSF